MKTFKFIWFYYSWVDEFNIKNVGELLAQGEYTVIDDELELCEAETAFLDAIEKVVQIKPFFHQNFVWTTVTPNN